MKVAGESCVFQRVVLAWVRRGGLAADFGQKPPGADPAHQSEKRPARGERRRSTKGA